MIPILILAVLLGGASGFTYTAILDRRRANSASEHATALVEQAQKQALQLVTESRAEAAKVSDAAKHDEQDRRRQMTQLEQQLLNRQSNLDSKLDELDKRQDRLRKQEVELDGLKEEMRGIRAKQQENLEKIAGLSKDEAKSKLLRMTERDIKGDMVKLVGKLQVEAMDAAEENAKMIVVSAMERIASDQTVERTVTTVPIASDELKGRIIGKEGRNIQTLERATGVDVIVDESPGAIVLSSFDPIRRQVARIALEKLLSDGRIHPARIEEVVAKAQAEVEKMVRAAGEAALKETGVVGVPVEMIQLLGQLKFRTS
ncbi:MAG: Rnase Y domain-containing protein, partial [Candidatus Saccharibacteria bacterium]